MYIEREKDKKREKKKYRDIKREQIYRRLFFQHADENKDLGSSGLYKTNTGAKDFEELEIKKNIYIICTRKKSKINRICIHKILKFSIVK